MTRVNEKSRFSEQSQPQIWWVIAVILPVIVTTGVLAIAKFEQLKQWTEPPPPSTPIINSINALGRLEPRGEVIKLAGPTGLQGASRVEQILVREGQRVKKGQVIAVLDSFTSNQAVVEEARARLQEARVNLVRVRTASPRDIQAQQAAIARLEAQLQGEVDAQQATIARLEAQLQGETIAQQATVNRLIAELKGQRNALRASVIRARAEARNAQIDARRYEVLFAEGAISQQERDRRQLGAETANQQFIESQARRLQIIATLQQQLTEAKANRAKLLVTIQQQLIETRVNREKNLATLQQQILEERTRLRKIQEVQPSDLQVAQAQVSNALAVMRKAEAQLILSYVVAPIAGEILKIHTQAGEGISPDGIAEIGQTEEMIVVAEVPEDSIDKVRLGQKVVITSDNGTFTDELQGTVFEIGRKIGKKDVLNTDPVADIDARVVEVKIALTPRDSRRVAGLTNATVNAEIQLSNR